MPLQGTTLSPRRATRFAAIVYAVVKIMLLLLFLAAQSTVLDQHMRVGQYYLDRKEAGRAATEFEAEVKVRPRSATAQYYLGVSLRLWGDSDGAEQALRQALQLQPEFAEAHFVLGLVLGDRVGSESKG